ncbi:MULTISPECIES: hypothetical protein [unclassified Rickettsia]
MPQPLRGFAMTGFLLIMSHTTKLTRTMYNSLFLVHVILIP